MSRQLDVRTAAREEVKDAYVWYEEQQEGLGESFLREVRNTLDALLAHPQLYPVVYRAVRRALLKRFRHGVFFIAEETIEVLEEALEAWPNQRCRQPMAEVIAWIERDLRDPASRAWVYLGAAEGVSEGKETAGE